MKYSFCLCFFFSVSAPYHSAHTVSIRSNQSIDSIKYFFFSFDRDIHHIIMDHSRNGNGNGIPLASYQFKSIDMRWIQLLRLIFRFSVFLFRSFRCVRVCVCARTECQFHYLADIVKLICLQHISFISI